ncbi:Tfp pilus assembly protein PilO [Fodinibius salinus]|uniref:Tfp pilus assembly protein PilO n=1 Tax=Fodinibius salinus TaxID=860790 RepID=A0A5D3YME2_9BACT|nr:type 4a pilus biogenesis protein PilO [Fodinibius salinus]TYP95315.1 Tfp pilus assembly protein PilO [Fodinibius salinus]
MSYGVRNTLILLIVLIAFIGAGWSYIYFYQLPKIEELEEKVEETQQELDKKQQIADAFPALQKQFEKAKSFFNNYNKALYGDSNEDIVYDFLNSVSVGSAYTDFTFSFDDSTTHGQYGVMNMSISGQGYYRNFVNFIRQLELSKPLNKITGISINPINELESYGKVNFNFKISSFYDRVKLLGEPNLAIENNLLGSVYNPFFPLIRSVKGNKNNLVNIEQSKLLAISGDQVFVLDQNGVMKKLSKGEEVYLGTLTSIDVNEGTATFNLNKGGIVEQVTLQINKDDEKQSGN